MTPSIDVGAVLRGAVSSQYTNLVTRHTGRAVRGGIERELADLGPPPVTIIDFSHVGLLDYSCADEIIAQLLLTRAADGDDGAFFVFRGVGDHLDPIEHVLEHHGLAIIMETPAGDTLLIGEVTEAERLAWHTVQRVGPAHVEHVADAAGLPADLCERALHALSRRRLVRQVPHGFAAVAAFS